MGIFSDITSLFRFIPEKFTRILASMPERLARDATEIRLRVGSPFTLTVGGSSVTLSKKGEPCSLTEGVKCTKRDIEECVSLLSSFSLYSFDETIKRGYIPLPGGGRAGVCGASVSVDGGITTFSEIYSVNLRIHRLYKNFAMPLIKRFEKEGVGGVLVYSPPALGKTSFLRSTALLLSGGAKGFSKKVAVVDERCELFLPEMRGGLIDVISGCAKAEGIELMTRSMSPQFIICDELAASDCEPLINAQNSGVLLIASAHGNSIEGIMRRPFIRRMVESGLFDYTVRIGDGFTINIERV